MPATGYRQTAEGGTTFRGLAVFFTTIVAIQGIHVIEHVIQLAQVFIVLGLGLETWHVVEHTVIIGNVIQNGGCPCPGIGDRALGISDTALHFGYNAVAFPGTAVLFREAARTGWARAASRNVSDS